MVGQVASNLELKPLAVETGGGLILVLQKWVELLALHNISMWFWVRVYLIGCRREMFESVGRVIDAFRRPCTHASLARRQQIVSASSAFVSLSSAPHQHIVSIYLAYRQRAPRQHLNVKHRNSKMKPSVRVGA